MTLVGLEKTLQELQSALESCNLIFLVGPPKSGKSSLVNLLVGSNVTRININYTEMHSHKEFQITLNKTIATRSILEMINATDKVVIIEDIDSLHVQDRYAVGYLTSFLQSHNLKSCKTKMIITCLRTEERRLQDLQKLKDSITIHITEPSLTDLYNHFVVAERYKITKRELESLCKQHKFSFSQVKAHLDASLESSEHQDNHDTTLYEMAEKLLKKNTLGMPEIDKIMANESNIITLILYENLANNMKNTASFLAFTRTYIESSVLEEYAYKATEWDLLEHVGIIRSYAACLAMKTTKAKTKVQYTQIPSRSAQFYINNKRIAKSCELLDLDHSGFLDLCYRVSKNEAKLPHR